ncbi:hypothetical protein DEU56DRAFT_213459 [Suillus clintonianus]|uniref:uncharacterized protein n=1 Tax=Suillus clintonianus TaxID=1904413 RepID=UPI001B86610C|nr:uncharacterized protein DEU56DRAFT_213459 [Suillus clintonianus]KAG2111486.1 hypothetical protein DEU56DRAFT_213459 [Suillus clintonianus]
MYLTIGSRRYSFISSCFPASECGISSSGSQSISTPGPPDQNATSLVQSGPAVISVDLTASAPSNPIPPPDTSVATSYQKSSWFASWTRAKVEQSPESGIETTGLTTLVQAFAKGSSISSETPHSQPPAIPSIPHQLPILNIPGDAGQSTPTSTLPQDIPTKSRSNDLPTPSPSSASYPFSSSPAGHHSRPGTASILSPLDENVPKLSPAKLSPATPSAILQSGDASQSNLTLNQSTSRFTLSIPLLGRPKLPLEQTVAAAQRDDIRTMVLPAESSASCKQHSAAKGLLRPSTRN